MIYFFFLLVVAARAGQPGKMHECLPRFPGVFTGVEECKGSMLNTRCTARFKIECDSMMDYQQYSPSGIPCGSTSMPECDGQEPIAFANPHYPASALSEVADRVASRLVRGASNSGAGDLLDTNELELYIAEPSTLNITFLSEGACDRNSFGFVTFREDSVRNGDPRDMTFTERRKIIRDEVDYTIMFPNVDFEFCMCNEGQPEAYASFCSEESPALKRGATMRMLPNFRKSRENLLFSPGIFVSLFLLDDGFDKGFRPTETWEGDLESILFSTPELNDPDMVRRTADGKDYRQHAFLFKGFPDVEAVDPETNAMATYDFSEEVFVCFEDRRRYDGGRQTDNDFEDLCFFITADPPVSGFEPSMAPTDVAQETPEAIEEEEPDFPAYEDPGAPSICAMGLLSDCGNVCCDDGCGLCGGCLCHAAPGGAEMCCPSTILFNGILCMRSSDVGCVVDDSLVCQEPGVGCDTM